MRTIVTEKQERRLSTKILAHKIKKFFPHFIYILFLRFRFYTYKRLCKQKLISTITYTDGSWISRGTTSDLKSMQVFLGSIEQPVKVLQIGIGNSSLFESLQGKLNNTVVGITIVSDELEYAKSVFPDEFGNRYKVFIVNKYSDEIRTVGSGFDYIVDNDISSYACCKYHFFRMLKNYHQLLNQGGTVLVGHRGLEYFDCGFGLTESMMRRIARKYSFELYSNEFCYCLKKIS